MKTTIGGAWLFIAGCALLAACTSSTTTESGHSSVVAQLFTLEPTPDRNTLQKTATGYLAALLADPANQEITLVKVDPAVVSDKTQDIEVVLPNGQKAQFHMRDFRTVTAGIEGWAGYVPSSWKQKVASPAEIDQDPYYYLSLVQGPNGVMGNLVVDGKPYRLVTLEGGRHAVIRMDESKLPPFAEPLKPPVIQHAVSAEVGKPSSAHSIIRMLMVTTNQVRTARPNYKQELALQLLDANMYIQNSKIDITLELAGYYDANYDEQGKADNVMLSEVSSKGAALGGAVYPVRDSLKADLVTLYGTAGCGVAWLNSTKELAYEYVGMHCPNAIAHEVGHNLGANHDWKPGDPEGNPTYMFGYLRDAEPRFHTRMSYGCGGACPLVSFYSNPRLTHQGFPLGTVEHHDVARRFNERRETVAAFYPDPAPELKLTLYGQGRRCTIPLSPGANVQLSWYLECKDPQPFNPESAVVEGFYGAHTTRKLCFADTLYTVNSCYSGHHNGDVFTISNIHEGTGRPNTLAFSRRLQGAVTRITYD